MIGAMNPVRPTTDGLIVEGHFAPKVMNPSGA